MAHDEHHEHLVKEMAEQFEPVFSKSPQGVYIYLDDEHKICNKKFAEMLGYGSGAQWVANEYPVGDVSEEDQEKTINAYGEASRNLKASKVFVSIVRKDSKKIKVNIIMAPITYKGEVFVIHFVSSS